MASYFDEHDTSPVVTSDRDSALPPFSEWNVTEE